MSELKPCPFCGRTPMVDDCGDHRYFVRCKCGIVQDKLYMQKCDATRRWNTRKIDKDTNVPSNDTISRQAALDVIFPYCPDDDGTCSKSGDDLRNMLDDIENLPSAQTEQTDCEYCHEDSDGYVKPIEKNCHAFICFGMDGWELSLKANGWHGSAKIKYCPMCGRKLKNDKR